MLIIRFLIAISTILFCVENISAQTYLGSRTLHEKIKSIEEFNYEYFLGEDGPYGKKLWETKLFEFDKNGYVIFSRVSNVESNADELEYYVRDENGNILESKRDWGDAKFDYKVINTYDEQGNILTSKRYANDGEVITTYDENGNELTIKGYDIDGKLVRHKQNVFGGKEKVLYKINITKEGFVDTLLINKFDDQLNLLQSKKYENFGTLKSIQWFEYNEENVLIKKRWKNIADSLWYSRLIPERRQVVDSLLE